MTAISENKASTTAYAILFAVAACHLFNDTMQAVLVSVYPMLRDNYALTFAQIGMITLVFQVTASLLQPLFGIFTDRMPLPYAIPLAPACTMIGLVLLATATSYPAILVAAAAIGIGSSVFHPEASRVTRLSSGGRYGFAQATFQVGGNVGSAVGPLLAAVIILPRGQGAIAWFAVFAVAAFGLLGFVSRWYAGYLREHSKTAVSRKPGHDLTRNQVTGALAVLLTLMFSKFVYTASLSSYYSFYLIDHFGVTPRQAQIYLFVLFASMAAGTFAGGPIGDRVGTKSVIWISILGTLPFSLALPYASLFWTVGLTIPIGLVISSAFSAMIVYAQELMPGRVGMISGMFFGLAFGVAGLGAAALGLLADRTSIEHVFWLCSFLPMLGFFALLLPRIAR